MATTTSTAVETQQQASKKTIVKPAGNDELDQIDELPRPSLQRSSTIHNPSPGFSHRHRHSKKLSLNFPIAVPTSLVYDPSLPLTATGSMSSVSQSPSVASPFRHGTPTTGAHAHFQGGHPEDLRAEMDGPGILTLIAGQERRVMELKEELIKAESELSEFKKQWSQFERKKKAAESRNKPVNMGPVSARSTEDGQLEEEEIERMKRREAREKERKMRDLALREAAVVGDKAGANANGGKGKGGRVFAGRHTRTLSLLQSTNPTGNESSEGDTQHKPRSESTPVTGSVPQNQDTDESSRRQPRKSISKQPTLQELISSSATGAAQLNLGKTYKELTTAGRKSLPPGTDVFVKQGKQVYDGINQGFWNFVEDIRQATVGDEAVHGPSPVEQKREVRQKRSNKKLVNDSAGDKSSKSSARAEGKKKGKSGDDLKHDKDNFWKEFGIETPRGAKSKSQSTKRNRENQPPVIDHESKSSTDSKCPPSLLADLMDVNDDDEAWDNWPVESPQAQRRAEQRVNIRSASEDDSEDEAITAEARREFNRKLQAKRPVETTWADLMS